MSVTEMRVSERPRRVALSTPLTECDVTDARAIMRDHKSRTGEGLSFTVIMAARISRAVAENRICHAYRKGRKLVIFDDVDIGTLVEHDETKPGFIDGRIEPREYLCMTVSVDHDIVDGIPAARFASRLRQLAEEATILS